VSVRGHPFPWHRTSRRQVVDEHEIVRLAKKVADRAARPDQSADAGKEFVLATAVDRANVAYASAILAGTPQAQLATPQTPKRLKGMTAEAIVRMERELSRLQEA
jgi:hypothetical protein